MLSGDEFYPDDVTSGPATDDVPEAPRLDYHTSQPGDHSPVQCAAARERGDDAGYHAGWGICSGKVARPRLRA